MSPNPDEDTFHFPSFRATDDDWVVDGVDYSWLKDFPAPRVREGQRQVELLPAELAMLLEGINLSNIKRQPLSATISATHESRKNPTIDGVNRGAFP